MLVEMLKAVSEMLLISDKEIGEGIKIKIVCARTILEKVITSLDKVPPQGDTTYFPDTPPPAPGRVVEPSNTGTPPMSLQAQGGQANKGIQVVLDASRRITPIKGLALDAPLLVDGKRMLHKDIIGKTMGTDIQQVKIL